MSSENWLAAGRCNLPMIAIVSTLQGSLGGTVMKKHLKRPL